MMSFDLTKAMNGLMLNIDTEPKTFLIGISQRGSYHAVVYYVEVE